MKNHTNMDQPTIATLPTPTFGGSPPKQKAALAIVDYSDKSFVVFGEATKTYKEQMKQLGGSFNMRLQARPGFSGGPGWIFKSSSKPSVVAFINQVNDRKITHHEEVAHQDSPAQGGVTTLNLPTVVGPVANAKYQSVHFRAFKPVIGMTVTVKSGGMTASGKVIQVETSGRNVVYSAYINIGGATSKLVLLANGYWQVWKHDVEHRVIFDNSPETGTEMTIETDQQVVDEHVEI